MDINLRAVKRVLYHHRTQGKAVEGVHIRGVTDALGVQDHQDAGRRHPAGVVLDPEGRGADPHRAVLHRRGVGGHSRSTLAPEDTPRVSKTRTADLASSIGSKRNATASRSSATG